MTQATSKNTTNKNRDVLNAAFHKSRKTKELIEPVFDCNSDFSTYLLCGFEQNREVLG